MPVRWSFMMYLPVTMVFRVRMIPVCRVDRHVMLVDRLLSVSTDKVEAHLENIMSLIVISETFFFLLRVNIAQFLASV